MSDSHLPTRAELLAREAAWFGRDAANAARAAHDITDPEVVKVLKEHEVPQRWGAYCAKLGATAEEAQEHWPTVLGVFADRMTGRA